ncbi:uncharacterized protein F5891DRAFT_1024688 [Suillus fuscotomentosus]|uniref:Uncharacterized protein n=1 Tax=Suillus fuscotomentosus TaxID=1912939 RepID=A0AAD4E9F7_9AGAM|nr:uncharacterized protein F5891DRAFT_1024688 [Suillus fuscotomentosus]KAG1902109.1 hypothetical protein F5891DRAFT_1024688 [Suillus fuscotomentosus]
MLPRLRTSASFYVNFSLAMVALSVLRLLPNCLRLKRCRPTDLPVRVRRSLRAAHNSAFSSCFNCLHREQIGM